MIRAEAAIPVASASEIAMLLTYTTVAPLLTVDASEQAYHVDYCNERAKYLKAFPALLNADLINQNLARGRGFWVCQFESW
ncbi:MAG: Fe-Mn family superoxide dismutase [Halieaceae bacterium]|nr:Fe-Mn family superoxide dismutase [Halieaceae bacterium]